MTAEELASLPVGTLVTHCGDEGEIVKAGVMVHILFPGLHTILVDTNSKVWQDVIEDIHEAEA